MQWCECESRLCDEAEGWHSPGQCQHKTGLQRFSVGGLQNQTLCDTCAEVAKRTYTLTPLHLPDPPAKTRLLKLADGQLLLNVDKIAMILMDESGNAKIITVNGSAINVEALLWQMGKEQLESAVDIIEMGSVGGLVSPGGKRL